MANLILISHIAYVAFVVVGLLAILAGKYFDWHWVRNPWFRMAHFVAMGLVAVETIIGMTCPLTAWENYFRQLAGQQVVEGDILVAWLRNLIFLPIPDTHWVFKVLYLGFLALIVLTLVLVPPNWKKLAFPTRLRSNK